MEIDGDQIPGWCAAIVEMYRPTKPELDKQMVWDRYHLLLKGSGSRPYGGAWPQIDEAIRDLAGLSQSHDMSSHG